MYRRPFRLKTTALLLWLVLATAAGVQAQETRTVTVTGIGAIVAGDRAKARDDAIQDALRKSVEQAVGILITSETVVENIQTLSDRIYGKTVGYIQRYTVVPGSEQVQSGAIEIAVNAVVLMGTLEEDLEATALLLLGLKRPRIMVVFEENPNGADADKTLLTASVGVAEATMRDALLAKGFDVVDQETVKRASTRDKTLAATSGDLSAAVALGRQFASDVIITGRVTATQAVLDEETAKLLAGMKSCQASVTAAAIRVGSGVLIAQAMPTQGRAAHINPVTAGTQATRKATTALADSLVKKILIRWQMEQTNTTLIRLVVQKVSFMQLRDLKTGLQSVIRGVKTVYQREYANNVAILDVEIAGTAEDLAEELVSKNMGTLTVNITGVSQGRVDAELKSK